MQRPTSLTVFGILNIVFGAFGLCANAATASFVAGAGNGRLVMPGQDKQWFVAFLLASTVLMVIAKMVEVASGVGILLLRPWGRIAAIGYGIYATIAPLVVAVVNLVAITLPAINALGPDGGADQSAQVAALVGGQIGGCLGIVYPLILIYVMTRPFVRAAFAGTWVPAEFAVTPAHDHLIQTAPEAASNNPFAAPAAARATELPVMASAGQPAASGDPLLETFIPSKNGDALASYYLGLFSLFPCLGFFLGLAAVYYGLRGLRKVRENPAVRGGVHAWVGLVCGAIFGLFNMLLLGLCVVGAIMAASDALK